MQKELMRILSFDNHLGCFGGFNIKDTVCKKFCALNLKCAIEQENNDRLEILDDLVSSEIIFTKIQ